MLAHHALPDKRARRAQDLTPVLKNRSCLVAGGGLSKLHASACINTIDSSSHGTRLMVHCSCANCA
jgi:hypothetical protein